MPQVEGQEGVGQSCWNWQETSARWDGSTVVWPDVQGERGPGFGRWLRQVVPRVAFHPPKGRRLSGPRSGHLVSELCDWNSLSLTSGIFSLSLSARK